MEKKSLIKAAKELVEVLGLQDEKTEKPIVIKPNISQEDLDKFFTQAIEMIDPTTDKVTKATQAVIDWYENPDEEEDEETDEEPEEAEDADEETEEGDPDEEDEISVEEKLKAAKKTAELKELLKEPEFKAVRKRLADEKNPIKLKKAMKDHLAGDEPVEKPKPGKTENKDKDTVKVTKKVTGYHRVDSVCEVLKEDEPKTLEEWIKSAAERYAEKTGKGVNLAESKTVVGFIAKALTHFDIEVPAK